MHGWERPWASGASAPQGSRWSEADARKALGAWKRSGESGVAFAASHGVSPQRLWYWQKRLRTGGGGEAVEFAEVQLDASGATIEIEYERVRIRIRGSADAERIAAIVRALVRSE